MGNWVRIVVFALVVGTISFLVHRYLWARLVRDALLPQPWHRIGTIAIIALGVMLPVMIPLGRVLPRRVAVPIASLVYGWMGVMFMLFVLVAAGDLVRLLVVSAGKVVQLAHAGTVAPPADPERRMLFGRGLAAFAAIGAALGAAWGVREATGHVRVKPITVSLKRLPASMSGLVVAQITDVHVGPTIGRGFIEDIVQRTNALSPDVIVITGDLVDGSVEDLREQVAPLGNLRAPLGVFFVTGNHEYYSGVDEWLPELTRLGIRVLRNERVELRRGDDVIDLAGVDDHSSGRFGNGHGPNLGGALAGRDPSRELLLLAHQPRAIVEAAALGVGLQLSGHTHGGQIFPWNFAVRLQQPYVAGLHNHRGAQIYVSNGTGYWGPPMRVGFPAEITKVTLIRATA
jgi:predicted MPP superfamily phosphohydrolase